MELRTPQYWLAELDRYGNPKLIDGSHSTAEGANQAAYLIKAMHLGEPDRVFAVAKVELSECVPSDKGVNHKAVKTMADRVDEYRRNLRKSGPYGSSRFEG